MQECNNLGRVSISRSRINIAIETRRWFHLKRGVWNFLKKDYTPARDRAQDAGCERDREARKYEDLERRNSAVTNRRRCIKTLRMPSLLARERRFRSNTLSPSCFRRY